MASSASRTRGSSSTISTVLWSTVALSRELPRHRDTLAQPEDLVECLPVLEAFEPRGAQLAVPHQLADLAEGTLGRDYMRVEQPRHALDARRRDHRPADHDELAPPVGPDRGGPHGPRADPDPDVEARERFLLPACRQGFRGVDHVDGCAHCADCRVLARLGHAEERDDLVADKLF